MDGYKHSELRIRDSIQHSVGRPIYQTALYQSGCCRVCAIILQNFPSRPNVSHFSSLSQSNLAAFDYIRCISPFISPSAFGFAISSQYGLGLNDFFTVLINLYRLSPFNKPSRIKQNCQLSLSLCLSVSLSLCLSVSLSLCLSVYLSLC